METNALSLSDFASEMANSVVGTAGQGVSDFSQAMIDTDANSMILTGVASILVAFAVVWGVWYIAKKLYRGVKAVR